MTKIVTVVGAVVIAFGAVALVGVLAAFPTKWLWNWLMPTIFALPRITAWQALGLYLLAGIVRGGSTTASKS